MTSGKFNPIAATLAFVAGVAAGVVTTLAVGVRLSSVLQPSQSADDVEPVLRSQGDVQPHRLSAQAKSTPCQEASPAQDAELPETIVEVIHADTSDDPSPELFKAHQARREKRMVAREAKAAQRRDFLSSIDLDLLTTDQRKLHAEYTEAVTSRDAARREILALRAKGDNVPNELQQRLNDAESVIRADIQEERRILREAAARASGLDEAAVKQLLEDFNSVDSSLLL